MTNYDELRAPTFTREDGQPFDGDHSFAFATIDEVNASANEINQFAVNNLISTVTWGNMSWDTSYLLPVYEFGKVEPVGFATSDLIDWYRKEHRESWIVHYLCGMISGAGCLGLVQALGWM